ncbi:hypothetical protein RF11_14612 [Thelohanellus kitauei]|uniref:Uncharacterized protein n=1 Tax=Thelohanellus kitauei TaxID=669202 RepID=A0A0C2J0M8_THEKT|nr:hypothetical protein RF11_14612 [Thelohanellus kitauei]
MVPRKLYFTQDGRSISSRNKWLSGEAIQTFKKSIMKSTAPLDKAIIEFLTVYRRTPLPSGKSPSELLNGRQMRTWIDTLKDSETKLQREENHQFPHKYQFIKLNEKCYVINHCVTKEKPDKRLKGTITQILGSRHIKVHLDDFNKIVTRHIDQTRPLHEEKHDNDHQIYLKYSKKCGHDSI